MTTICKVFAGEVFKLRRTTTCWIIILFPILATVLFFLVYSDKAGDVPIQSRSEASLWVSYARNFIQFFVFFLPMLAALVAFSLVNVEDKNNGWKLIYTQPVNKYYFYFSKIKLLYLLLLISIGLGYVLILASGFILSEMYPQLNFSNVGEGAGFLLPIFFKHFVVVISIATIHFVVALCWNNFVICVGSACFMTILGLMLSSWKHAYLLPYTNSPFIFDDLLRDKITWFPQYVWVDALWILGFIIAGYFVVKYKQTK